MRSRALEFLFLLSLLVFPLFFGSVNLWGFSTGAVLLCGVFAVRWFRRLFSDEGLRRTPLDGWILAYLGTFLLSLCFSKIPYLSWVELFKLTVVALAFFAARYFCRGRHEIYRLGEWFIFIGGLYSAVGLLQFVGGLPHEWWSRPHMLSSTYVNHNHFAGLLNLALPVSLGMVLAERDKPKKVLFLFLSVLMGVALIFTLSRAALISFCVSAFFMAWVLKKRGMISITIAPLAVFLGLVAGVVLIFGTNAIEQRLGDIRRMTEEEDLSVKIRWLTWQGTLPMIGRYFWFGSGPGTFSQMFLQFRPESFYSMRPVYALNDFLHLWAECGVFSFSAMAGLTAAFFRKGLEVIHLDDSRLRNGLGSGILAGVLGLLVHGLFNFNFHIPANWLLSAVAAGLLFSMGREKTYSSKNVIFAVKGTVSLALVTVLAAGLFFGVSDYRLWEAKKLLKEGEGVGALEAVEASLHVNPLDAEAYYLRGRLRSRQDPQAAMRDFDEAIKRNPYEPVYDMARIHALAPRLAEESPAELVRLLKTAIDKDPNNRDLVFMAARETFGRARARHSVLRETAGKMFEQRKSTLAGLVAYLEKSDLWLYHRKYHLKLLGLDPDTAKKETPADLWNRPAEAEYSLKDFDTKDGEAMSEGEVLYKNGELSKKIDIHNPLVRIVLNAKGTPARAMHPVLYVKIDGHIVDEYYVDSKVYKNYYTDLKLSPGAHLLSFEYVNDLRTGKHAFEDRNVWMRRVELRTDA